MKSKRLAKKTLSLLLTALILASLIPAAVAVAAEEINVTLSYKDQTDFLMARHSLQVTPGLSEKYRYVDAYYGTTPTVMDALVAAHIKRFGEDSAMIAQKLVASGGFISNMFGDGLGSYLYTINGELASIGADSMKLRDRDVVEFFAIQDMIGWSDSSGWFEVDGTRAGEITVGMGESFTLALKGIEGMGWGNLIEIQDAQIKTLLYDGVPFGGATQDRLLGVTDTAGEVAVVLDEPGIHYLSAFTAPNTVPFQSPWLVINVVDGGGPAVVTSSGYSNPPPSPYIPPPAFVDPKTARETTLKYIAETLVPAPVYGDEWGVMTLARAEYKVSEWYYEGYFETVRETLKEKGTDRLGSATDNAKLILALTAIGVDATDVSVEGRRYDLVAPLLDSDYVETGLNNAVFALLALDAQPYADGNTQIRDEYIRYIASKEYTGGGFGSIPDSFEPDMTGMVLQALAPYKYKPEVMDVIARALEALHEGQKDDGGYESREIVSAENSAQVIVAATALGHDPMQHELFIKTGDPLTKMLGFHMDGGGFVNPGSGGRVDSMSTYQAAYALVAYDRYMNMKNSLYTMRDCMIALNPMAEVNRDILGALIEEANSKTAVSYTVASWNAMSVVLADAEDVFEDAEATQAMVNRVAGKLNEAINRLFLVGQGGGIEGPFTVTFTLQGLSFSSLYPETWIERLAISDFEHGTMVADVVVKAFELSGYTQEGAKDDYIESVTKPDGTKLTEYFHDDYPYSGWLYKVNGTLINAGINNYLVESGDDILLYFTTNFKEDPDASKFSGDDFYANRDGSKVVSSAISAVATVKDGTALASVRVGTIADALAEALNKLADVDDGDAIAEVKVNVTGIAGAASVKTEIKAESLREIATANEGKAQLTIDSGIAALTFDTKALAGLAQEAANDATVEFHMESVDSSTLDASVQDIVGTSPVYNLIVTVGGKVIHNFAGVVTVALPFDPAAGVDPADLTVYWLPDKGEPVPMEDARYDEERRIYVFSTSHFSLFFIAEDREARADGKDGAWVNPFIDVKLGDWFYEVVRYVFNQHLMVGTAADRFSPDMLLSRATLLTVLHRIAGAPVSTGAGASAQVPEGMWYTGALLWADEHDILADAGSGLLDQPDNVTREELAKVLLNFQRYADKMPRDILMDRGFADWDEISGWAKDAVNRLTMQGLLNGKPGNLFDPKGNATRAEFAAVLMRYLVNLDK